MNVFILDRDMEVSAAMMDDAHLLAQISEATQILMANYNREHYPNAKIGHVNHPVTVFYFDERMKSQLVKYLGCLLIEYRFRFGKDHQNYFWHSGYYDFVWYKYDFFKGAKTYVGGAMTDNIDKIRKYIMTKPHKRPLKWTNREKPDWWVTE